MQKSVMVVLFGGPAGMSKDYMLASPPGANLPLAIRYNFTVKGKSQTAVFLQGDPLGYYFAHILEAEEKPKRRR